MEINTKERKEEDMDLTCQEAVIWVSQHQHKCLMLMRFENKEWLGAMSDVRAEKMKERNQISNRGHTITM
jgi:hypothetical protein